MTMEFFESQNAFAAALLHPGTPLPQGITTAQGAADPARFAVYRNNVYVGLTTALAQRFPVTRRLVGADFFAGMARAYAADHKPPSPLIMHYGDDFPYFITAFPPAACLAYLADVARVEVAWTRAYHAADGVPLEIARLAVISPGHLLDRALVPHPSAQFVQSPFPVGSIWSAHQGETVTPIENWRAETVLVVRPAMQVEINVLPPADVAFAARLFAGASLGEAAETALAATSSFDFGSALIGLIGLGAFSAVEHREGDLP
ncbi:DNA-binding domain-containing protein [Agrobacterium tumefaciens]|uniref:HvfC/BufC N-terminal domain-containing protein n=1 Tax=Agrobacterium tumefaciens TaxID=358 RepID=UPI0015727CD1|nr:putative DNA-binding domain-containing protein [Agrobacterium tumefaciens]WCJ65144.1 DNA-binding domain-containing protein [Agrobacterium tumefaciens]